MVDEQVAAAELRELQRIGARSAIRATAAASRAGLLIWGAAWSVGYPLLVLLRGPLGWAACGGVMLAAAIGTAAARSQQVRTGREWRTRTGWIVLLAASPVLVLVAMPAPPAVVALLLGALWGTGLVLFAVAVRDAPLAAVGSLIVIVAGAARLTAGTAAPAVLGVAGGAAMLVLGAVRMVRGAR